MISCTKGCDGFLHLSNATRRDVDDSHSDDQGLKRSNGVLKTKIAQFDSNFKPVLHSSSIPSCHGALSDYGEDQDGTDNFQFAKPQGNSIFNGL